MYFLTDSLINLALHHFEYLQSADIKKADWFFGTFGPGNIINAKDRPYERFSDYEKLLEILRDTDQQKYEHMHKGTPFFFLSWLAFDLRNYEKALYYLDASISEDVRNAGEKWKECPGAFFLKLSPAPHVAERVIHQIRDLLSNQINRFNSISGLSPISLDDFSDKFVTTLMSNVTTRTIISAFYIFLLEGEERIIELKLKSTQGSSLGPILSHLFSGALIFESLLKYIYPMTDDGTPTKTIGKVFQTKPFISDFGAGMVTSSDSLKGILDAVSGDDFVTAFSTVSKLRNTTGHNIIWDNIFHLASNYEILMNQILNALLYLIEKKFLRK